MEQALHRRIVGQDEPISTIARAVRRARAGSRIRSVHRVVHLPGPTGVGKTELAKALAEFMFGSEDALLQLDMSSSWNGTVSRLVGAPRDMSDTTGRSSPRPYAADRTRVLFDEVERRTGSVQYAPPDMEDGHLSDAKGARSTFETRL